MRDDQEAAENFLEGRRDDLTRGARDEQMPQTPLSVLAMETPPLAESDGEGDDLEHDFHTEPSECWTEHAVLQDQFEPEPAPRDPAVSNFHHLHNEEVKDPANHPGPAAPQPSTATESSIYHLHDGEGRDLGPTSKHDVATVSTSWKTGGMHKTTVLALCDSGCNTTAIRKWLALAFLKILGGTWSAARAGDRLISASGEAFVALGCVKLTCWVKGKKITYWYTVYEDNLPFDVVWGTDFMRHMGAIMDFGAMTMTIAGTCIPLCEIKQRQTKPLRLTTLEAVTLRPGETMAVRAKAENEAVLGLVGRVSTLDGDYNNIGDRRRGSHGAGQG